MFLTLRLAATLSIAFALFSKSQAQQCPGAGAGTAVTAAKGFSSYLLTNGLTSPRGLVFDPEGNLLMSQRVTKGNSKENGIFGLKLKDEGGCVSIISKQLVAAHPGGAVSHIAIAPRRKG